MDTYLSHDTALAYWRYHFSLDSYPAPMARAGSDDSCASRKKDVLESIPEEFVVSNRAVDVLVFEEGSRRRSSRVKCHAWQTALPQNAFHRDRGVCVSSPEFVFLQMASKLPIEQLIALGCELCGTYVLQDKEAARTSSLDEVRERLSPLTNTERIAEFLAGVGKARGKGKASRALKYVIDGSRSPMETMVYMLLCLPVMLGGYGLPKPEMNATIALNDEARAIARRRYCEGDLCWSQAQLDIEYHGEVHVGAAQMKSDVGRELGIEHMGWRVITVTSPQVFDARQFEVVAKEAASRIGRRLRRETLEAVWQRDSLRYELDRWMLRA